jgi:hypothetical protein
MESGRRLAFGRQVAGAADLTIAPGAGRLELADDAVADQFAHAVEIRHRMPLHADLCGKLVFLLHPVGPHHACLFNRDGQRLLAVDVQVAVERPVGDKGMRVIGRADDNRVEVLLLQTLPPIDVSLGLRETLERVRKAFLVDIAQRHNVIVGQRIVMCQAAAPNTDDRYVEFVAGRILARAGTAR